MEEGKEQQGTPAPEGVTRHRTPRSLAAAQQHAEKSTPTHQHAIQVGVHKNKLRDIWFLGKGWGRLGRQGKLT